MTSFAISRQNVKLAFCISCSLMKNASLWTFLGIATRLMFASEAVADLHNKPISSSIVLITGGGFIWSMNMNKMGMWGAVASGT